MHPPPPQTALLALALVLAPPPGSTLQEEQQPLPGPEASLSAFIRPLYLDEEPPPLRSLRTIQLVHTEVEAVSRDVTRTPEETRALAADLVRQLRDGADFEDLARRYSATDNAPMGSVLGSFARGILREPMDRFLWSAEVGQISDPIEAPNGIHVLQRIETYAATRHIMVSGSDDAARERIEAIRMELEQGADFADLAREHSDDPISADKGGLYTIYERGSADRLLKRAAFDAAVGEVVGPIESPIGLHLLQRVPLEGHDPALRELTMVRVRAILISHNNTALGEISARRSPAEAQALAADLYGRIQDGEDMAELARRFNDDLGGRERAGDIGWVHRGNPRRSPFLERCFTVEPGGLVDPILTRLGWVVLRRER